MSDAASDGAVVLRTLDLLARAGIRCDLFGGWAEELLGLRASGSHGDLDLVCRASDFVPLDVALPALPEVEEVRAKRFAHKRAFTHLGLLCEILLVQGPSEAPVTVFWNDTPFAWETPLLHPTGCLLKGRRLSVVSAANLLRYRRLHRTTQPHRWCETASIVPPLVRPLRALNGGC
ncbi:MAG: hypothetical protein AB7S41_16035 [Parvibaculaceae bacterium]